MTTKKTTKMTTKSESGDIAMISFVMGILSALEGVDSAMDMARSGNVSFDEFQTVIKRIIENVAKDIPEECRNYEDEQSRKIASLFGEQEGTLQ